MQILRLATTNDTKALLQIYDQYIDTKTTFEEELPSEVEFQNRISSISKLFPYLACEENGKILGYAYAHKYRERAAYQWSAELSIYLDQNSQSKGIGKRLYHAMIEILKLQGIQMVYSGVTIPNIKSEGLHMALGFQPVGIYHNAGYKCGTWHSVKWFELTIGDFNTSPKPVIPISDLSKDCLDRILSDQRA